jgi:two-component system, CitB family, sensor kinase
MLAMALRRGVRSTPVAGQILRLQLLVLVAVVLSGLALAYVDARRNSEQKAADVAIGVAVAVADSPVIDQAISQSNPSVRLQPFAEQVRRDSGTDFVVIMNPEGIRWTHPDPANIGKKFLGSIDQAQRGIVQTERYTGTLGPSIRAVAPVTRNGSIIALVGVGIILQKVNASVLSSLPLLAVAAIAVLVVGIVGTVLISRRLRRQTHGLGEIEMTRMYEYYDAVLHSVREGLLLLDAEHRIQLMNPEGARLLGLSADDSGRLLQETSLPPTLVEALSATEPVSDEIHLVDARMLVVNGRPAGRPGRQLGSVITVRDHTDIQAMAGELDTVRGMADSLRSQNHEAANRLHTVVSLIEIGRPDDAVTFATQELESAQRLTDHVVESVDHPVVAALLLGKTAQAAERGITLQIRPGSYLRGMCVEPHDAVTLLGNLIDNAIDATAETDAPRRIDLQLAIDPDEFTIEVEDSGPGLSEDERELAFRRGWSTKVNADGFSRGIGLALVVQTVRRYSGQIDVSDSHLGGARFRISIGSKARGGPR